MKKLSNTEAELKKALLIKKRVFTCIYYRGHTNTEIGRFFGKFTDWKDNISEEGFS